jgi:hypothetical protein
MVSLNWFSFPTKLGMEKCFIRIYAIIYVVYTWSNIHEETIWNSRYRVLSVFQFERCISIYRLYNLYVIIGLRLLIQFQFTRPLVINLSRSADHSWKRRLARKGRDNKDWRLLRVIACHLPTRWKYGIYLQDRHPSISLCLSWPERIAISVVDSLRCWIHWAHWNCRNWGILQVRLC